MEEKRTWVLAEDDDMILREDVHLGKPSIVKLNILCEINSLHGPPFVKYFFVGVKNRGL